MKIKLSVGILAALGCLPILSRAQTVDTVIASALFEPHSVAVDANNNYYITDSANNRIVRYVPDTAVMSSFAGLKGSQGTNDGAGIQARFFDPKGIVYVPARNGFVVADSGNHLIRLVALNGAVLTIAGLAGTPGATDGPGNIATFRFPSGLAADTNGNVFIADSKNNIIRKLDLDNAVTTVAGGFYEPSAVTVGDNGQLFVADTRNHSIQVIETNGVVTLMAGSNSRYVSGIDDSPFASSALFNGPSGLLWLGTRNGLLVSDTGNNTLRRIFFNTNSDVNAFSVETFAGIPGQPGFVNGAASVAKLNNPAGLAFDTVNNGFLVVDLANNALRRIQTSPPRPAVNEPRIGYVIFVKDSFGELLSKLVPVTQSVFNNEVIIAILPEAGTETFFTSGPSPANPLDDIIPSPSPRNGNTPPPYQDGLHPDEVPPSIINPQPDVTIKSIGTQDGRRPSSVVQGRFQFKTANPAVLGENAASFPLVNPTAGAVMYYTLDGSDPINSPPSSAPAVDGDKISLIITNQITFKIRAFRDKFKPSEVVTKVFEPTNSVPNQITFGFDGGEASSEFVGAAGQRFYAPVTLSLLPKQKIYSLQFNLNVTNLAGSPPITVNPSGDELGFESRLVRPIPGKSIYRVIPPSMFTSKHLVLVTNNFQTLSNQIVVATNFFVITNFVDVFTNLMFTNYAQNLLGVGWLERSGETNLYDSTSQDLITFSLPHDTLFESINGKVVLGAFAVEIPPSASADSAYQIKIDRPSATDDGIGRSGSDIFILAPTDRTLAGGSLNAVKNITVGQRRYIVGDAAPFRWFNAGDFGNSFLLNDDIEQVFQSAVYHLNSPPPGSDFFDAMDSSDGKLNGAFQASDGSDTVINNVQFGDGELNVDDVFVSFRRSLDPALKWFTRYWQNGVRVAAEVPNLARGTAVSPAERVSNFQASTPAEEMTNSSDQPSVFFVAGGVSGLAGETISVPIQARIIGPYGIRVLMLNLRVDALNGAPALALPVRFLPSVALGDPTFASSRGLDNYAAAWLNDSVTGINGTNLVGTLQLVIPENAGPNAAYKVEFEHISASPNGLGLLPQQVIGGIVTIGRSQTSGWGDGIPDDWRQRYFDSVSNPLSRADADPDADGVSNWSEFKAGTNPTDNRSLLRLMTKRNPSNLGLTLRWPTMLNKTYVLERSASLDHPDWIVLSSNIIGTGDDQEVSDSSAMTNSQFYRVRLVE